MAELLRLVRVSHAVAEGRGGRWVLRRASLALRSGEHLGILAPSAADRATVCRLLAGRERPLRGRILRGGRVLWPPGLLVAFHPRLSAWENITHIARTCGFARPGRIGAFCRSMSGLESAFHAPVATLSPGQRLRLAHALALALDGAIFFADESIAPAEAGFRAAFLAFFRQRLAGRGLVFLSADPRRLELHCNRAATLAAGRLVLCGDFDEAARLLAAGDGRRGAA